MEIPFCRFSKLHVMFVVTATVGFALFNTANGQESDSEFLRAAALGDVAKVKKLILANTDVHQRNKLGRTAMHLAAQAGHRKVALAILDTSPPPKQSGAPPKDGKGKPDKSKPPVKDLFSSDDGPSALDLMQQGGFLSFDAWMDKQLRLIAPKDNAGQTPLHLAVAEGQFETADALTSRGAPTNAKDKRGRTPLHLAVLADDGACVALLLSRKADPTIRDQQGKTALDIAASKGIQRRLEKALGEWAKKPADDSKKSDGEMIELLGQSAPTERTRGESPLSLNRSPEKIQNPLMTFLEKGPDAVDSRGRNALHLVAASGESELLIELLEEEEARPLLHQVDRQGFTPLHIAILNYEPESAAILIKAGSRVDSVTADGRSPLHAAAMANDKSSAELLLKAGANPAATDNQDRIPSTYASDPELVKLLDSEFRRLNFEHKDSLIAVSRDFMLALQAGDSKALRSLLTPEQAEKVTGTMTPYKGKAVVKQFQIGPKTAKAQVILTPELPDGPILQFLLTLEFKRFDNAWLVSGQNLEPYP